MGYFFRRSAKFGPFRLNFSKSGIGTSVGVKGARLTMTPRGTTYVTVGRHGFYYRETLSSRGDGPPSTPARPALTPPIATSPSDEIVTADVSDLADSSSETLIQRLNERAKMFNPAWMLYGVAAAISVGALVGMFSAASDRDLPDVTSPLSTGRKGNTIDEYATLVTHYGYPDSVLATDALSIVPVRAAYYVSPRVKVIFVQNGCVAAYEETMRTLAERSRYPSLAKRATKSTSTTQCAASPNAGWAIVGYVDPAENAAISADIAKVRLDNSAPRQTSPPNIEVESAPVSEKVKPRTLPKKQVQSKPGTRPNQQTWPLDENVRRDAASSDRWGLYPGSALLLAGVGLFGAGIVAHKKNTEKRTSRLFYELDETQQQKYSVIQQALAHLGKSHRAWRIEAKSATADWKRNAGASTLVRRVAISVGYSNPPRVEANLAMPCINIGPVKLFFLPDVILYMERGTYGGIAYEDLRVEQGLTRFIEDEDVPGDATVVDQTWRYVNKSGGPDRRFNNNAQLPVAQYGVLVLTSSRGLNIHLNTSNAQESLAFASCWRALHSHIGNAVGQPSAIPDEPEPSGPDEQAFRVLGLNANSSSTEISAAYRHLAQMYHPDKVAGLAPEFQILAEKRMKEINAAYEALKRGLQTPNG